MKNKSNKGQKKFIEKLLCTIAMLSLLFVCMNSIDVQAATQKITSLQYHPGQDKGDGDYYYDLYPSEKYYDYKKFLKYTYKISDDSVIGLAINKGIDFDSSIITEDDKGNPLALYPYDVKVFALGPGTSTLKVYNGKQLIDSYTFTVIADSTLSPSSFVNNTGENYEDKTQEKINQLIKKFVLAGADEKNTTTNQRVLAALNATIAHGGKVLSEKEYEKWSNNNPWNPKYSTVYWRLIEKVANLEAYARVNRTVLNNLGFVCSDGLENSFEYRDGVGKYGYDFKATTKLTTDYDFNAEEPESIYKRTHLPAWINGEDTAQQVIDVGQTISLPSSDMNNSMFSSDTSVVTAIGGKITGVKPGVAIVYRYNDTYCDVFCILVNEKGSAKTVQAKIYTKSSKMYFTNVDYAPYILGGKSESCQIEDWDSLRIYDLEPIFGHGGSLKTTYSKGKIKCYVEYNEKSELIYTVGSGKYAY